MKRLNDVWQLIDAILAGCMPDAVGPVVAEYQLWNKKIARASYYRGANRPDAIFPKDVASDDKRMIPLASKLLNGSALIIETGRHDMVCTLEWNIT